MRDHLKDMEYFNEFINEDSLRIKKFSDKLKKGEVRSDRIIPVRSKIHDLIRGLGNKRINANNCCFLICFQLYGK